MSEPKYTFAEVNNYVFDPGRQYEDLQGLCLGLVSTLERVRAEIAICPNIQSLPMRQDREHHHQSALFRWAALQQRRWPELRYLHAIPNGGDRHPAVAAKLKSEGVRKGAPDIYLDVPRHGYHGLRIELKAPQEGKRPAGKLSPEQAEWLEFLAAQGYLAVVCVGWESARDTIIGYMDAHDRG